jgi:8-oxo-dGTP diphosphatase
LSRIHVAAGVILNAKSEVLLALRPLHKHQGGLWEFPGGKVEAGEKVEAALARELLEELNLAVETAEPLLITEHDYGDKQVVLDVWVVRNFTGEPHGREGQSLRWVPLSELANYKFPKANEVIVQRLLHGAWQEHA